MQFNRVLFANRNASYHEQDFPGTLLFIPRRDQPGTIPCSWYPRAHSKIIVYFHGIGDDLGEIYNEVRILADVTSMSVLAVEYPGYGVHWDHGICTEKLMMDDAKYVI